MRRDAASAFAASKSSLGGRTILQVVPHLDASGSNRAAFDIAAALSSEGAVAAVAAEGGRSVSELQARGGVWLPFPASSKSPLTMYFNALRLSRLIREERVDLVHSLSGIPAWAAQRAAQATGTPFVTNYHAAYAERSSLKQFYNSVIARADAVIAASRWSAEQISLRHPGANGRICVIPQGVDFKRFSLDAVDPARVRALRAQWGCAPDERIIFVAGRRASDSGHRLLIEAMRILAMQNVTDVSALFAVDERDRSESAKDLNAALKAAGVSGRVRRVAPCVDMPAALLAASVLAAPFTKPEAFGRAAAEAQAMGTPVVATDIGAVSETILAPPMVQERERTGWRIPPNDPHALARALLAALAMGASAREAMSSNARAHIRRNYSLEAMSSRTLDIYRWVLELQSGAPAA